MKVTAKATRAGDWWAIEVPEVPGAFTQTKRLDQVTDAVRDAVSLLAEVAPESIDVEVAPQIDVTAASSLAEARAKRDQAAALERQAAESIAGVARELTGAGLTLRDVGVVLGVSHQRVGQLVGQTVSADKGGRVVVAKDVSRSRRGKSATSGRYVVKSKSTRAKA